MTESKPKLTESNPKLTESKPTMTEDQFQISIFWHAWNYYPQTRRLLFHVPNGGKRNKLEAIKLKQMGVVRGVADIIFYWDNQMYCFELKVQGRDQSEDQLQWEAIITDQGAKYYLIREFDQFFSIFVSIISTSCNK